MNTAEEVKKQTYQIISTIKKYCVYKGYFVSYIDGVNKKITYSKVTSDDIADHLLFIFWASKEYNDKELYNWAMARFKQQMKISQLPNGLFIDFFPEKPYLYKINHNFHLTQIHFNEDFLVGLLNLYELTKDKTFLMHTEKYIDALMKYAITKKGYLSDIIFAPLKIKYPKSYVEAAGLYIESLCQLYEITKQEKYLNFAKKLANTWIQNDFFKKNNYFPERWNYKKNESDLPRTKLMKSLTNMSFGLMTLYETSKDEKYLEVTKKVLDTIEMHQNHKGAYKEYLSIKKNKEKSKVTLYSNHAMADVLLKYYLLTKDKDVLNRLDKCMNFWYGKQNKIGLTPSYPFEKRSTSTNDHHGDMATMFLKYYELTKEKKYYDYAKKAFDALKYFQNENTIMDVYQDGSIAQNMNKTKFLGGICKFTLAYYGHLTGKSFFNDRQFSLLVRDR